MKTSQALAFVKSIVGFELCTGAGENESACYAVSPVPRAFMEGALGAENVRDVYAFGHRSPSDTDALDIQGHFLIEVGEALIRDEHSNNPQQ